MVNAKTYSQKPSEITRRWILIDASSASLGRVSTVIAKYLIGKYKPNYTPHMDGGDYVVVINAEKIAVTGAKEVDKMYHHHSGFPGGLTSRSLAEVRARSPEKIIEKAVWGMIPHNKLATERLKRLRVFVGENHTHTAQTPEKVEIN